MTKSSDDSEQEEQALMRGRVTSVVVDSEGTEQYLMRGPVMSATIGKFAVIIRLLDQKAQVMIFLNSIFIPVCINALEHGTYSTSAVISIVTAVMSILAAIICIYPKRRYHKDGDRELNLLHFNDIGHMKKENFMNKFKTAFNDAELLDEMVINDLYDTARYSMLPKYGWLKLSYALFAFGNIGAIIFALLEVL